MLATNELDTTALDDATLLEAYKAQNVSVERGFRFLKDPLFFANSLYLEKPQRIMALQMVLTLSLLVYALAERWVRQEIKNSINQYLTKSENQRKTQHSDAFFKCLKALMYY